MSLIKHYYSIILSILLFALALYASIDGDMPFFNHVIQNQQRDIKRQEAEIARLVASNDVQAKELQPFYTLAKGAAGKTSGKGAQLLRNNVEQVAGNTGFNLRTVGDVQTTVIDENASLLSVAVSGDGGLGEILAFIQDMADASPRGYWQVLSLRPNNQRNPDFIVLEGRIVILEFADSVAAEVKK